MIAIKGKAKPARRRWKATGLLGGTSSGGYGGRQIAGLPK
jgi:hypothetical protein